MREKKHPRKYLEDKRSAYFLIGLALALGISMYVIEWKTYYIEPPETLADLELNIPEEEVVSVTVIPKRPLPPPPPLSVYEVEERDLLKYEEVDIDPIDESLFDIPDDLIPIDDIVDEFPEEVIPAMVHEKPVFPGCEGLSEEEKIACFHQRLMQVLNTNFKYPPISKMRGEEGIVYVHFYIGKDGNVEDSKVARSGYERLDNEALRLINLLPKSEPGKHNNRPVRVPYTVPITFRLK